MPFFRKDWTYVGTALIILSGIGTLIFAFAVVALVALGGPRDPFGEAIAGLVGCLLLVAVGVLLVIIGMRRAREAFGPGSTLFGAAALAFVVGLAAVIYGFTACF